MPANPALVPDDDIVDYGPPPGWIPISEAWFEAFIHVGEADIAAGRIISQEDVEARLESRISRSRAA